MQLFNKKENCCGCKACYVACPQKAIQLRQDEQGFVYPEISKEKCIDCGICQKVCPLKEKTQKNNFQEFYAVKNKNQEIRSHSSSGGFFDSLVKKILEKEGSVFGVILNENLKVIHYGTNQKQEAEKFKTSKYVQSDTKNTYQEAKELLELGKLVLYSGTPCQIYGLKKYLKKDYENLITVDNICHGVPSPILFEEHKKYLEEKYHKKIKTINFRYKMKRGTQNLKLEFLDGTSTIRTNAEDEYYRLFQSDYILRQSCYQCQFASTNRVADITMGDFWDFQNFLQDFDDGKGVSLILLNTKKGKELFEDLKENFEIKKARKQVVLQPNLERATSKPEDYCSFWRDYQKEGYQKVITKYPRFSLKVKIKKAIKKVLKKIKLYKEN